MGNICMNPKTDFNTGNYKENMNKLTKMSIYESIKKPKYRGSLSTYYVDEDFKNEKVEKKNKYEIKEYIIKI